MRVRSISLAEAISSARVSNGISPICMRYIRTGSSMCPSLAAWSISTSSPNGSAISGTASSSTSTSLCRSSVSSKSSAATVPFSTTGDSARPPTRSVLREPAGAVRPGFGRLRRDVWPRRVLFRTGVFLGFDKRCSSWMLGVRKGVRSRLFPSLASLLPAESRGLAFSSLDAVLAHGFRATVPALSGRAMGNRGKADFTLMPSCRNGPPPVVANRYLPAT